MLKAIAERQKNKKIRSCQKKENMIYYQRSRMRADLFACAAKAVASKKDARRGYNNFQGGNPKWQSSL